MLMVIEDTVHYRTDNGPACDPGGTAARMSGKLRSVTCAECLHAELARQLSERTRDRYLFTVAVLGILMDDTHAPVDDELRDRLTAAADHARNRISES